MPDDYKFHCFGEKVFVQVDTDRFSNHTRTIFNDKWEQMPFTYAYPAYTSQIQKPQHLKSMQEIAKRLGKDFAMVRVDMYHFDTHRIVGELTFTPEGGTGKFDPNEWDKKFGTLWLKN